MIFGTDDLLRMDYRILRRYTEEAILKKPSLGVQMRELGVKELFKAGTKAPAHMARLRCISAYIGAHDPCKE